MKPNELKPFQELHHTDKLLRLDHFGGIKCNLDETDNPLIECIFTPFELPDPITGIANLKPNRYNQFVAGLAVGYLPALFLGQYFRNGKRAPKNEWLPEDSITLNINISDSAAVTECTLADIPLAKNADFISHRFNEAISNSCLKKLRGALTHSSNKNTQWKITNQKNPLPAEVLIHEMEIIRFYLTNSSHSCKNIFTGAFSKNQIGNRVINELHESCNLDAQTGKARFVYRHGYTESDAPALGRILFESNNLGLDAAQRVHIKTTADRINSEPNWLGYPRTLFPFTGNTRLTLTGRWLKTDPGYIFLAYRIHSCSAAFPFKVLSYADEMMPGGNPPPDDAKSTFSGQKTIDTGPANDEQQGHPTGESKSNQPPNAASKQLLVELREREYVGLANVHLIKEKLRDSTHKSEKKPIRYVDSMVDASTGGARCGDSSTVRQSITEEIIVPSPITADLETFFRVVAKIQTLNSNWKMSRIVIGCGPEDGEQTSYFPKVECRKHTHIMRSFSFTDIAKLKRRRFLCVQIGVGGRYVYLFEAQRRLKDKSPPANQSPYKEDLPFLLLHAPGFEEVESNDFLPMIVQTVKNKTWPNDNSIGFHRDFAVHGHGVKSIDELSTRVAQLVLRNLEKL